MATIKPLIFRDNKIIESEAIETGSSGIYKILDQDISGLKLVVATGPNNIKIANPSNYEDSQVLGVLITAGLTGSSQLVKTYGEIEDSSFNFAVNKTLFLGALGQISDTVPVSGHHVRIGYSLGVGKIFLDVNEPIIIT